MGSSQDRQFNILISQSGEPLLADFGLSHVQMASAKRSVRWTALELFSLSDVSGNFCTPDKKSDIWAFGMTVYVRDFCASNFPQVVYPNCFTL